MADNENKVEAEAAAAEAAPAPAEQAEKPAKAEKADKADKPAKSGKASKPADYTPRLKADYDKRIAKAMTEKFGYKNKLEVPRLDKIVINMGVGEGTNDKKLVEKAASEMEAIA